MRITNKRIRQFLLTTGDAVDPDTIPDTIQMYNSDGSPFNLDAVMAINEPRHDVAFTTPSLTAAIDTGKLSTRAPGGGVSGFIALAIGAFLVHVNVSRAARVRLYTSAAKRDADVARDRYTDPINLGGPAMAPDHGCLAEFLLLSDLDIDNIPADYIYSVAAADDKIYYRVDNFDLTTGPITVTLTIKDIEL